LFDKQILTEFTNLTCPKFSKEQLKVWNETLNYVKSFGIKILNKKQFQAKELELSKNLSWRFRFF
jgi:hypothetical protein